MKYERKQMKKMENEMKIIFIYNLKFIQRKMHVN